MFRLHGYLTDLVWLIKRDFRPKYRYQAETLAELNACLPYTAILNREMLMVFFGKFLKK
jgi:hypothetical protein